MQEDGTILKRTKDYNIRKGVCNKSIATNQAFCIQVLHSLLRCFDNFMKAAVHVKAGVFDWSDAKPEHKIKLGDAKHKLQNKIVEETGVKWDFPDKTGKGGNTTIGNNCKRLIHLEREVIISELPDDHKDTFRYFGQHLSVILRVMSSKEKVDVEKFKHFCTDLYLFLLQNFTCDTEKDQSMAEMDQQLTENNKNVSWIKITPTVHKVLAHSWELIAHNDGVGLGSLDESGLEGCNKILRNVRTNISRKTSQNDNLVDTIKRMW